jgi:hypothetical protein
MYKPVDKNFFESESYYVAQAVPKLLGSSDPPTLAEELGLECILLGLAIDYFKKNSFFNHLSPLLPVRTPEIDLSEPKL